MRQIKMKMKPEHFATLQTMLAPVAESNFHRSRYLAAGLSTKRFQWDAIQHVGAMTFVCDVLYKYLNDEHIQTALNKIIKPLE